MFHAKDISTIGPTECTVSQLADGIKLGGDVDSLDGQDALQRDPDMLESWAVINWMKCNKSSMPGSLVEWSHARHKYKQGEEWLESSAAERDRGDAS